MKKIIKVVAIIASVMLTLSFIACSNPSSSDGNSNDTNDTNTTGTTNTSNNAEDPFAGTTWVNQLANQELSFKADMTVTFSGTKYNYSVEKENNKYIANILSPKLNNQLYTFTLETKEATTGIMNPGSITFTKKEASSNTNPENTNPQPTPVDSEDPFASTTWEADTGNMGIVITTIKFSNNKTVDYYMTTYGTKTSLYSGPYEVTKNYLDVEGQYGASVGSQTFVIPNKDATSVSWDGKTFIKK